MFEPWSARGWNSVYLDATTFKVESVNGAPPAVLPGGDGGEADDAIRTADPSAVDPQELVAQATELADRAEPHAVLVDIYAKFVVGGAVDLSGEGSLTYRYEYKYLDATQPPGRDGVAGAVTISVRGGRLIVSQMTLPVEMPAKAAKPEPICPVKKAWSVAVASGVPADAVASLGYSWSGPPFYWEFRVAGHPELDRKVDAATCNVAGRAPAARTRPRPGHGRGPVDVPDPWK